MPRRRPSSAPAILVLLLLGWLAGEGLAEPLYVPDLPNIPVRRGPGLDYKIMAFLDAGMVVDQVKSQGGWSLVNYGPEKSGWVLERYLTSQPPLASRAEEVTSENQRLVDQVKRLETANAALKAKGDETRPSFAPSQPVEPVPAQELGRAVELSRRLIQEESDRLKALQDQQAEEEDLGNWFLIGAGLTSLGLALGEMTFRWRGFFRHGRMARSDKW